ITLAIAGGLTVPVLLGMEYITKGGKRPRIRKYRLLIPAIIFLLAVIVFAPPNVQGAGDLGQNTIETTSEEFKFAVSPAPFYGDTIRVDCSYFMRYFETTHVTVIFYKEGIEEDRVSLTIESTSPYQQTEYAHGSLELRPGEYDVIVSSGRTIATEITQSRVSGVPSEQGTWNTMKMVFYAVGVLMIVAAVMVMRRTPDTTSSQVPLYYYGQFGE
ncbi:MAG: hypothetical protein ACFFAY_10615, partial [Promethearchaeota archaeon]